MAKRQVVQLRPQETSSEEALGRFLRFKAAEGLREVTLADHRQKIKSRQPVVPPL